MKQGIVEKYPNITTLCDKLLDKELIKIMSDLIDKLGGNKMKNMTQWVYHGYRFLLILATTRQMNTVDGKYFIMLIALTFLLSSYFYYKKIQKEQEA